MPVALFATESELDVVRADGGQRLTGRVESVRDGLALMRYQASAEVLRVDLNAVRGIEFARQKAPLEGSSELVLLDGSRFAGTFVGFDGKTLSFDSLLTGPLELDRSQLASLYFQGSGIQSLFYASGRQADWPHLSSETDWSFDSESQSFTNQKSGAEAGIVLPLNDHYEISFEVTWTSTPKFELLFGARELEYGAVSAHYKLMVNRGGVSLKRKRTGVDRSVELNGTGTLSNEIFSNPGTARFRIEVEPRNQLVTVYVNDELAGRFPDPENGLANGGAILLKAGRAGHSFQQFKVKAMSGGAIQKRDKVLEADRLVVRGSEISGFLKGVQGEGVERVICIESELGGERQLFEVTVDELLALHFKGPAAEEPKKPDRAETFSGEQVFGELTGLDGEYLSWEHPSLGALKLKRSRVSRVERGAQKQEQAAKGE